MTMPEGESDGDELREAAIREGIRKAKETSGGSIEIDVNDESVAPQELFRIFVQKYILDRALTMILALGGAIFFSPN